MGSTQYTLRLLTEYAYTLDLLPLELSKNLADLRELDAVLSAPITAITGKLNLLADVIEGKTELPEYDEKDNERERQKKKSMSKSERLDFEFNKTAMEAKLLKLGSDDKIKVASQTADLLANRQAYLSLLLSTSAQASQDNAFIPSFLHMTTTYPHLPAATPVVDTSLESTRRKRAASTRGLLSSMAPVVNGNGDSQRSDRERERDKERDRWESPNKKRRTQIQEEERVHHRHRHHHHSHHTHKEPGSRRHPQSMTTDNFINSSSLSQQFTHPTSQYHTSYHSNQPHRRRPAPTAGMLDDFLTRQARSGHRPRLDDDDIDPDIDDGEIEEVDDPEKVYCICGSISWGEMLGCDDDECRLEWFHLSCLGLSEAPKGSFICDECKERRAHQRKALDRAIANAPPKRSHKKKERMNGI